MLVYYQYMCTVSPPFVTLSWGDGGGGGPGNELVDECVEHYQLAFGSSGLQRFSSDLRASLSHCMCYCPCWLRSVLLSAQPTSIFCLSFSQYRW